MLRLVELALFLAPFAVYALWWWLGRLAPPPAMLAGTLLLLAVTGAALVWFGVERRLDPHGRYVPARLVGDRIMPGHSASP
ncbi:MAG: hypothetical protein JO264_03395 [Acidisphaera sp.]|nr:hypothetical protein [Acidisphaera sp.]